MNYPALESIINNSEALAIFFSAKDCGVCTVLKPNLKQALSDRFPKLQWLEVMIDESPEIAGQLQLFSVPTFIVYFEGKEALRKSRNFSVSEVTEAIQRPYELMFEGFR